MGDPPMPAGIALDAALDPVRLSRTYAPPAGGLVRRRLLAQLGVTRFAMILASAGSGKTTLLAQHVAAHPKPVAWVTLEESDGTPDALAHVLAVATDGRVRRDANGWSVAAGPDMVLVLDDAHRLAERPAGEQLDSLLTSLPSGWEAVVAGRSPHGLRLESLAIHPETTLVTWDDLRFRLWEIEQLFSSQYGLPLSAVELPSLSRNTGGWATALHLFNAAAQRTPLRRTALIQEIRTQSATLRHYVHTQLLYDFDPGDRLVMAQVAAFEHVRRDVVASLLGRRGLEMVDRLHHSGLLTLGSVPGELHLHALLRDQLLEELASEAGHDVVTAYLARAAEALERHGHLAEATRAYLRAGREGEAARLGGHGPEAISPTDLAAGPTDDGWILWAEGAAALRQGSLHSAQELLTAARRSFEAPPPELHRLVAELSGWLNPSPVPEPARPYGALRRWLAGDRRMEELLNTDRGSAGALFRLMSGRSSPDAVLAVSAAADRQTRLLLTLAAAAVEVLRNREPAVDHLREAELLLQSGVECPALERLFLALTLPASDRADLATERLAADLARTALEQGDELGSLLIEMMTGRHSFEPTDPEALAGFEMVEDLFGDRRKDQVNRSHRRQGRSPEVPARPGRRSRFQLRLIGPFGLGGFDEQQPKNRLKPQHLAILQALALRTSQWTRRDQLCSWFWPESDHEKAVNRLSTALTEIRKLLRDEATEATIEHGNNAYKLELHSGGSDLAHVVAMLTAVEVEAASNPDAALETMHECLDIGSGLLLESAPPGFWIEEARWRFEGRWERTVGALLHPDQPSQELIDLLPRLLGVVPRSDVLWRRGIQLAADAGAHLRARQLERIYGELLLES